MCGLVVSWEPGFPHRVRLDGELDLATASQLASCVAELNGPVEVDCSRLTFVDAAGMTGILSAHRACTARGDMLALVGLSPWTLQLLHLVQLDAVVDVRQGGAAPRERASGEH